MNTIIQLKIQLQRDKGQYVETKSDGIGSSDGHWVILQDWNVCNKICGGGTQTKQKMCVPPTSKTGKPCPGFKTEYIVTETRSCNTQPCPSPEELSKNNPQAPDNKSLPPVIKMMAVSTRPQRYDKCFIKEGDAMMEKKDESTKNFSVIPKIPIRLVMNDKTISAYIDDTLQNRVVTFLLKDTVFIRITNEKRCFYLQSGVVKHMFCQLDSGTGDFVEEWDYDFNLFKNQCFRKREHSTEQLPEEKRLEKEFQEKVNSIKLDIVTEKANLIKKKTEEDEENVLVQQIDQVRQTSQSAVAKEIKMEELLEKEEEAKESNETETLTMQIETEKKKEECLLRALKEKQIESQYNSAKAHAETIINQIKQDTQREIASKRLSVQKRIAALRKKQERKAAQLKGEIMTIRAKIAEKLKQVNKVGNKDQCKNGLSDQARENYCQENFTDNYVKFTDCKDASSFCYVCCENEFGDLHITERDSCYAQCDRTKNLQNS